MGLVELGRQHLDHPDFRRAEELEAERWWWLTRGLTDRGLDLCSGELPVWVEDRWKGHNRFDGVVFTTHRVLSPWGGERYAELRSVRSDDKWFDKGIVLSGGQELRLPGKSGAWRKAVLEAVLDLSEIGVPEGLEELATEDPRPAALSRLLEAERPPQEAQALRRATRCLSQSLRWGGQARGLFWTCPLPEADTVHALMSLLGRPVHLERAEDRLLLDFEGQALTQALTRKRGSALALTTLFGVDPGLTGPSWNRMRVVIARHTDATLVQMWCQESSGWAELGLEDRIALAKGLVNAALEMVLVRALFGMEADLAQTLAQPRAEARARFQSMAPELDPELFLLTRAG